MTYVVPATKPSEYSASQSLLAFAVPQDHATPTSGSICRIADTGDAQARVAFMYLLASDESHNQPPSRSTSVRQKPTTTIADVITFLQKTVEMKRVSPSMAFACLDRLKTILDHYSHRYGVPFARFPRIVLTNDNTLAIFFAFGPSRFEVEVQSEESVYYAYRGADASDELDETSHSSAPIPKWFVEHALGASARES